jgi:multidrug resistance efflux pump
MRRRGCEVAVAIPFDTLDYARKLESAGVPAAQAELQASALGEALARAVATLADLLASEGRLGARIDRLDARIDNARLELEARIDRLAAAFETQKWMFGFVAALNIGMLVRLLMTS